MDAPFPFLITPPLPFPSLDSYAWLSLPIYNAIALDVLAYTTQMYKVQRIIRASNLGGE